MPRRFLSLLTVLAFATAVVLAIARPGASPERRSGHHQGGRRCRRPTLGTPWAYIDKIQNGAGWCDPNNIDATSTEYVGDSHQFALCVGNLPGPVHSFQATIGYDGALDECIDEQCQPLTLGAQTIQLDEGCVDDNPDANAGSTFWGDGLGAGWDCFFVFADGYSLGVPESARTQPATCLTTAPVSLAPGSVAMAPTPTPLVTMRRGAPSPSST